MTDVLHGQHWTPITNKAYLGMPILLQAEPPSWASPRGMASTSLSEMRLMLALRLPHLLKAHFCISHEIPACVHVFQCRHSFEAEKAAKTSADLCAMMETPCEFQRRLQPLLSWCKAAGYAFNAPHICVTYESLRTKFVSYLLSLSHSIFLPAK